VASIALKRTLGFMRMQTQGRCDATVGKEATPHPASVQHRSVSGSNKLFSEAAAFKKALNVRRLDYSIDNHLWLHTILATSDGIQAKRRSAESRKGFNVEPTLEHSRLAGREVRGA